VLESKLSQNAASHVEAGEEVREVARVRKGMIRQQNHALIATDRNVYAFRLKWPGQTNIAERICVVPLDQAEVETSLAKVTLRNRGSGESWEWRRLRVENPSDLAKYVNGSGAGDDTT
jgi:hypothetical protein